MIPTTVQWELTDRCNYACTHCYFLDTDNKQPTEKELPNDKMWNIAEKLVENKLFFVTLTGGEPLLRKKLVIELVDYFTKNNIRVSLNTNLVLMDEVTLSKINLYGTLVSCPSSNHLTYKKITGGGSYGIFERKLDLLIESGKHHTVNMVVSKLNLDEVRSTAERMVQRGVKRFAATPVSLNARFPRPELLLSIEEFKKTLNDLIWVYDNLGIQVDVMEALPKCIIPERAYELNLPFISRSCFAGKRNGSISSLGDVRPCGHNPNSFGNLLVSSISEIWDNLQNWRKISGNEYTNCLACDILNGCGGGCAFSGHPTDLKNEKLQAYMDVSNISGKRIRKLSLSRNLLIKPYKDVVAREDGENWLMCSNSSRNIIQANKVLYDFIQKTRQLPPMSVSDLAEFCGTNFENNDFEKVVRKLIEKCFFVVCSDAV